MVSIEDKRRAVIQHYLTQRQLPPADISADQIECLYNNFYPQQQQIIMPGSLAIVSDYTIRSRKWSAQNFVEYFHTRYKSFSRMLQQRQELQNLTSIARLNQKGDDKTSIIGMVASKDTTKNGNIMLSVEDPTGVIKVIITKKKPDLFGVARDLVLDEVIGIVGSAGPDILFADSIVIPDVPKLTEVKKASEEVYAIALSCIHVGSKKFLGEEFLKFIRWLRGEVGTAVQQAVAAKVRYIFVVGDIVDGIGIYPNQESELAITDIKEQYAEAARFFAMIPQDKHILFIPGNHDAVRLGEPQPPLPKDLAKSLWDLPNATLLSNPAMVNIHASEGFPGFDVLMYHGYSYIYYGDTVEGVKQGLPMVDRVPAIMKFLLQRRHLAPTHASTVYVPDPEQDALTIDKIPDIFVSGHMHKAFVGAYRGVMLISASCWQDKTDFQEKVGVEPEPCRVPLINLQTREVRMLRFEK